MRRSTLSKIYAIFLTACFLLAEGLLFCLPVFSEIKDWGLLLIGLVISLIGATVTHELGHVYFAHLAKMRVVTVKFFCVKIQRKGGRYAISMDTPWSPDHTDVIPVMPNNMEKRAKLYAIGGVVFGGAFLLLLLVGAVLTSGFGSPSALFWGSVPYAGYLFLLNAAPFEYPSGKTDVLVYWELCQKTPVARATLMAMEVQGFAYRGTPYAAMGKELFDFPTVAEDEPIFSVCNYLKYRLALDEEDYEGAADALNRLAQSEAYLSGFERERLAAEITYLNFVNGNISAAKETAKYCEGFLTGENITAKRVLATVAHYSGKKDETALLKKQAEKLLEKEEIQAEKLLEEKLLASLSIDELE